MSSFTILLSEREQKSPTKCGCGNAQYVQSVNPPGYRQGIALELY